MVHAGSGRPERVLALLWDREPPPTRGPRARSSKAEIVAAAVRLADRDGLAGLSMRRLAEDLGLTAMSLYPHVGRRSDLLDLMLDQAFGGLLDPEPASGDGWRTTLERYAERSWALYRRHPWVLEVGRGRATLGPAEFALVEQLLGAFDDLPVPHATALRIIDVVGSYVRGAARAVAELRRVADGPGAGDLEHWRRRAGELRRILDEPTRRRFPRLADAGVLDAYLAPEAVAPDDVDQLGDAEATFAFGLARLLDGVDGFLTHAGTSPS